MDLALSSLKGTACAGGGDLGTHTDAGTDVTKAFFSPIPSKSGPRARMQLIRHTGYSQMLGERREDFLEVLIKVPVSERRKMPPWCFRGPPTPNPEPGASDTHGAIDMALCPPGPGPEKQGSWGPPKVSSLWLEDLTSK